MTLPNKEAGLAGVGLEFAFTNDGSIPGAIGRTRDTIEDILKGQLFESDGWQGAHSAAFAGLPEGVPLFLGLAMRIVEEVTGLPIGSWVEPGLEIIDDVFGALGTFSARLSAMFPSLDFMSEGGWNPVDAIVQWITEDILPTGLFATIENTLTNILQWLGLSPDGDENDLLDWASGLLDGSSLINAANIIGSLPGHLLGMLSISNLSNVQQELLIAPTMDHIENVVGGNIWHWDSSEGHTSNGCVKTTATGSRRELLSNTFPVTGQDTVKILVWTMWSGLAFTGTPIELRVRRFTVDAVDGMIVRTQVGEDLLASPTSPGASSGWVKLEHSYNVPDDCDELAVLLVVTETATAGTVHFDDASAKKTGLLPVWLVDTLEGSLGEFFQIRDILAGAFVTPVNSVIADVKDWWASVQGTFMDMGELFGGGDVEIPSNPISEAINDFFGLFFRGGSQSVVTQNKVAEPSGIPPLDADVRMPWEYLPVELMTVALGMPWCLIEKTGNQSITASTETLVTGLSQSGPATVILSGNRFKLPFDGMWNLEVVTTWSSASATAVTMNLRQNDVVIRKEGSVLTGIVSIPGVMIPAATTDEFSVYVNTAASGLSVQASGTFIRATYMGQTTVPSLPPPLPPVTFDAAGGYDDGGDDTLNWTHTFGPNAKTIVVPISQENAGTPVVTCGPYNVPVLSGPSHIGNYFGANARCTLAAAILPDAVKGTAQPVTVTFPASLAGSATSMSFNDVGSLGAVITSSGTSNPYLNVPANVKSMVAMHFGGMDVNFSSFNRTLVRSWGFSAFNHWAHIVGYSVGGAPFSASGGRWHGKGIELHP